MIGQYVQASCYAAQRGSACALGSSGRVFDHALERRVQCWPIVIRARVPRPDPLVYGDSTKWRLSRSRQRASCGHDQPPVLSSHSRVFSISNLVLHRLVLIQERLWSRRGKEPVGGCAIQRGHAARQARDGLLRHSQPRLEGR